MGKNAEILSLDGCTKKGVMLTIIFLTTSTGDYLVVMIITMMALTKNNLV